MPVAVNDVDPHVTCWATAVAELDGGAGSVGKMASMVKMASKQREQSEHIVRVVYHNTSKLYAFTRAYENTHAGNTPG